MTTVEEIRYQRLIDLIAEHGGQRQLAEKIGRSPSQISQIVTRSIETKSQKPRTIGSKFARHIEESLGLPPGSLDSPTDGDPRSQPVSRLSSTIVSRRGEIGLSVEEVHARLLAALPAGAMAPDLGTVKSWFDGTGRPLDVTQLKALYDALGLDLDEHRATPAKEPETAVEQAMLERFRCLPAGRQAKLLALLQDDDA